MDATPFELKFPVEPGDIDLLGHVNNVVYLRWVQDIAIAHWRELATAQEQAMLLWVVVRHEIDYKRQTFLGDVVLARTWVGEALRRSFERHTELLREADGRLLARARTLWCPIDKATHKAISVNEALRARFSVVHRSIV
ncbi:MAG: thioesterase family protein [Acidihalobacter sp.]|jgi:acyl-CoA thioester hydrolase|uniref:acyl-CoA thioesterase n=1 Tax=Acidihalobacter sp. TaxID=1872108 RepID=UPI00307E58E0